MLVSLIARAWAGDRLVASFAATVPERAIDLGWREWGGGGDELDRVDGAGAQLDLLGAAVDEQLAGVDPCLQGGVEAQHAVEAKHVRDEVVGERGEPLFFIESRGAGAVEVGRRYLGESAQ